MRFATGNRVIRPVRISLPLVVAAILLVQPVATGPTLAEDANAEVPTKTVKMTVENFKWVPDQLRVPKGTKLILQIRSYDATHRFDLKKPYNLKAIQIFQVS